MTLHSLLRRQLRACFGSERVPDILRGFVGAVDGAYRAFDADRAMLERSLELSSQELLQANAEMRSVLRAFPDIYFRVDLDGRILDCKGGGPEDFLRPAHALIGRRLQDLPFEEARVAIEAAIAVVRRTGQPASLEYALRPDGRVRHYEARFIPLLEGQIFGIVRNITERKALESRLIRTEKLSAVGRLAAGVAHEINNPLGVILGFAQSAARNAAAAGPLAAPLRSIEREALRCRNLVRDLLVFSRRQEARLEPVGLDAAVEATWSILAAQARARSVAIERVPGAPRPVLADRGQLEQVLVNLCENAIDAVRAGGRVVVRTYEESRDDAPQCVLEVEDDGPGVPEGIRDRIFEPFFTTKEVGSGTGLGLALVHEIVQRHKGSVEVLDRAGGGAVFKVRLPASDGPD